MAYKFKFEKRQYERSFLKRKWQQLKEEFGGCCKFCTCREDEGYALQFAHIKPTGLSGTGRGSKARYYDIKKNRHCYSLLCVSCHLKFDAGKMTEYGTPF